MELFLAARASVGLIAHIGDISGIFNQRKK